MTATSALTNATIPPIQNFKRDFSQLMTVSMKGDSMSPKIKPGDGVVIDTTLTLPTPEGLFALRVMGELDIVRLQWKPALKKLMIIRENPTYKTFVVDPSAICIVGRVIGIMRYE
ncbi:S24 family peptidase [Micavibrio aeruginosavorus]|uniref:S24 family peptidase n=1 Tax=Micavibrio aeruginosavorus TaxID=349221 RepID=UPI000674489C|nr:S24 family peptidase [Micavibrio aeruginosavorus]